MMMCGNSISPIIIDHLRRFEISDIVIVSQMDELFNLPLDTDSWDFITAKLSVEDQLAFSEFKLGRVSPKISLAAFVLTICTFTYFTTLSLIRGSPKFIIYMLPCLIFTLGLRIPFIVFLFYMLKKRKEKQAIHPVLKYILPYCELFVTFSSQGTVALFLLARVMNGKCNSLNQLDMWNCNSEFESRALPQELIVALMLYPIANSIIFKNLPAKHVAISWGLSLAVISLFIGFTGLTQSLPALVFYTPFSAGFLLENHRQDLILFHVVKSQKKLLLENQQMSDEMATELRHMIANVAHDLKTVLILSLFLPNLFILICSLIAASVRVHERH
jgi:hypothetical protein